jgi:hypothetical protein
MAAFFLSPEYRPSVVYGLQKRWILNELVDVQLDHFVHGTELVGELLCKLI